MKKFTLNLLFILLAFAMNAQMRVMQDIEGFTAAVQKASGSIESIQSDFEQVKQLSVLSTDVSSGGRFYFERPDKVRWEYSYPEAQSIVINGQEVHLIENGEVKKADARASRAYREMNNVIAEVIHGDAFSNDAFAYGFFESEKKGVVEMEPLDASMGKHIEKITLLFNADHRVDELTLYTPGGDFTKYSFSGQTYNQAIPEQMFRPEPLSK